MRLNLSIRSYLAALIIGCLIPLLLFSGALIVRSADREQSLIARNAAEQVKGLANDLDRRLRDLQAPLFVLASDASLQDDDFAAFQGHAMLLARRLGWAIALADRYGNQIVNTRSPFGAVLPKSEQLEAIQKVIASGQPYIADLRTGANTGEPTTAIVVPVMRDGRPTYFLMGNIVREVNEILAQQEVSRDTSTAVIGRDMRIIARIPRLEATVGTSAREITIAKVNGTMEGAFNAVSRDGVPMYTTFAHVPLTGWSVAIGTPSAKLFEPVKNSILTIVAGGSGMLLAALGITSFMARRVAHRISNLSELTTVLTSGGPIDQWSHTRIREIDAMAHSLVELAALLRQQIDDRDGALAALRGEISDRKRIEQQLVQAQKMEAIGHLTGGIAHDFNNIIGAVVLNLEIAADHLIGTEPVAETVDAALREAMRAADLTRRLLAFARQQAMEPRVIDINVLIAQMTTLLRRVLGEAIVIVFHPVHGLWSALADPALVEDVLLNLSINARDAMPDGGDLKIEAANTVVDENYAGAHADVVPGDYVSIIVSDTGCGMPPEVIERAFEPFFTTKTLGAGSGLGLSMVYGIAKQSGGHVTIESEVGRGTKVRVLLPRGTDGAVVAVAASASVRPKLPGGAETILVVDDEPGIRRATSMMLAGLGYRLLEAEDAASALAIITSDQPIDLLLTDIGLPGGMNGPQLAEEARKHRPCLRILLISGYTGTATMHGSASADGMPLIVKPFRRQELALRVREILDKVWDG